MKRNYVNNKDFLAALKTYKAECQEAEEKGVDLPQIPRYIGECIQRIATRLSTKANFSGYTFREEMVSDGIENACQAVLSFKSEKSDNPFAYFTQIIHNAFLRRIDKEKKQLYVKYKISSQSADADLEHEHIAEFVRSYENKLEERRQNAKRNKAGIDNLCE